MGCVVAVRNSLRALEGIQQVTVDPEEGTAVVDYVESQVSIPTMTRATTDIGFPSSIADDSASQVEC